MILSIIHCLAMLRKNSGTEVPSSCQWPTWLALTRTLAQGEKDGPLRKLCFSQLVRPFCVCSCRTCCEVRPPLVVIVVGRAQLVEMCPPKTVCAQVRRNPALASQLGDEFCLLEKKALFPWCLTSPALPIAWGSFFG